MPSLKLAQQEELKVIAARLQSCRARVKVQDLEKMAAKIRHLNEQFLSSLIPSIACAAEWIAVYARPAEALVTAKGKSEFNTRLQPFAKSCSKDRALKVCEVQKAEADRSPGLIRRSFQRISVVRLISVHAEAVTDISDPLAFAIFIEYSGPSCLTLNRSH